MKKRLLLLPLVALMAACHNKPEALPVPVATDSTAVVYMTTEISPESLIRIYDTLGIKAEGRVAVKISTGESGGNHYLSPKLISKLVQKVNGTIVECNTAYWGKRDDTQEHWQTIREHGFLDIAPVDIMDEEGEFNIPVRDTTHIPYNIVGSHLKNYDFMINLVHFKGHTMAGYGGAIKNQSIGVASANGKMLIHSAGRTEDATHKLKAWSKSVGSKRHDMFLESMAASAQAVVDYMQGRIIYINVMNNLSVDCDCDASPKAPEVQDVGILASTDPVALDQACLDIIYRMPTDEANNPEPLRKRISSRNGQHTVDYAASIGLGTQKYTIVIID